MSSKCLGCGSQEVDFLFTLGKMPPVNAFVLPNEPEEAFSLDLCFCKDCSLIQLGDVVPPQKLFSNYLHMSSASAGNIRHLNSVADLLASKNYLQGKRVLEVGSNDGTLLALLKDKGAEVLGVDPAENLAPEALKKGVQSKVGFFNEEFASDLAEDGYKFDTVVALNVMAHTPTFMSALKGIRMLLQPNGVFMMENAYVLDTILEGQFDTIYHEHVFCFSLHALCAAYEAVGLAPVDAEIIPTQGTSIRVFVQRSDSDFKQTQRLKDLLQREKDGGFDSLSAFQKASENVVKFKEKFEHWVAQKKNAGEKIVGMGAPARGVVILNYCGTTPKDLDFVVDDTVLKQGRMVPGRQIPVKGWDSVDPAQHKTFVALSWNYADDMLRRLRERGVKGKMLMPFPEFKEVEI